MGNTFAIVFISVVLNFACSAQQAYPASTAQGGMPHASGEESPQKKTGSMSVTDANYVIGPGDVLNVQVWREPELSAANLPVRPDGKISLSLINDVQASDKTPMQLSEEITEKLKKYVSDPQVTIVVTAINSKRFYVIGQVARPGAFPLLPKMTVLQALSSAGGFQQYANPKKMYVLRNNQKMPFDYKRAIRGKGNDKDFALVPGDTIVVP
jgi:polysaccharide biosynthesis/export protein